MYVSTYSYHWFNLYILPSNAETEKGRKNVILSHNQPSEYSFGQVVFYVRGQILMPIIIIILLNGQEML